ncbi:hypothetical protein GJ496_000287 [Pomphorhynchus laevis]|nr:hypothetical protein GJ496_000287 [Pomphorhynchus laevis]
MFRDHHQQVSRGGSRPRLGRQLESSYQTAGSIRDYRTRHEISRGPAHRSYQALAPSLPPRRSNRSDYRRTSPLHASKSRVSKVSPVRASPSHSKSKRVDRHRSNSHHSRQTYHLYLPRLWPCRNGQQMLGPYDIHHMFPLLYIPSTFSHAIIPDDVYKIDISSVISSGCQFYVVDRKKDETGVFSKKLAERIDQPAPTISGISFRHSVKVVLLSTPTAANLFKKCTDFSEAGSSSMDRGSAFAHQNKMLSFLHGMKTGKSEALGIGGQWHPELDGSDPDKDPMVLIRTAIRCTRELVGLDLSKCSQWYKILEMRYLRPEKSSRYSEGSYNERIESTTVLMPDVWSLMPSESEWKDTSEMLTTLLAEYEQDKFSNIQQMDKQSSRSLGESGFDDNQESSPTNEHTSRSDTAVMDKNESADNVEDEAAVGTKENVTSDSPANNLMNDTNYEDNGEIIVTVDEVIGDCTHEMKNELEASDSVDQVIKSAAESEIKDVKVELDLPPTPHVLINPSRIAKENSFDCKLNYLVTMLDYNHSQTKEHNFELSLFSEVFNHCLARSHALLITSSLAQMNTNVLVTLCEDGSKIKYHEKSEKSNSAQSTTPAIVCTAAPTDDTSIDDGVPCPKKIKLSEEDADGKSKKNTEDTAKNTIKHGSSVSVEDSEPKLQRHPNKPINSPSNKFGYSKEASGYRTVRPELLLAFSYFDHKNSRILTRKDLAAIIESTNLCLTRAEISKMVDCACGPGLTNFYYRNMTDGISPDNIPIWPLKGDNDFTSLSNGRFIETIDSSKPILDEESGAVTYRGRTIYIDSVLQSIDSDKRLITDLKVKIEVLESEIVELRNVADSSDRHVKQLLKEIETLREMLSERKKQLSQVKDICARYESCFGHTRYTLKRLLSRELDAVANIVNKKDESKNAAQETMPQTGAVNENDGQKKGHGSRTMQQAPRDSNKDDQQQNEDDTIPCVIEDNCLDDIVSDPEELHNEQIPDTDENDNDETMEDTVADKQQNAEEGKAE